jgi:hypothetical protein
MTMARKVWFVVLIWLAAASIGVVAADDISGTWTASFDTQIGQQDYTYTFTVKDSVLTGKAKSNLGAAEIKDGKVEGDKVTFTEILDLQGMPVTIKYTGKIISADEIKFTRQVEDVATEELTAKRAK